MSELATFTMSVAVTLKLDTRNERAFTNSTSEGILQPEKQTREKISCNQLCKIQFHQYNEVPDFKNQIKDLRMQNHLVDMQHTLHAVMLPLSQQPPLLSIHSLVSIVSLKQTGGSVVSL